MTEEPDGHKYTDEMKIVSAVWVHERFYNNQTWKDIIKNFQYRFNLPAPAKATLLKWEAKLFTTGSVDDRQKSGRSLTRLMHVPYVKESLKEDPTLSLRERARKLGLARSTLLKILQEDLNMVFEVDDANLNKRHAVANNGKWKKRKNDGESGDCIDGNIDVKPSTSKIESEGDSIENDFDESDYEGV